MSPGPGRATRSSPAAFAEIAPVFTALGDPTRLHLVSRLCQEGPLSIVRLTEGTTLTRQAVTKHLRALERVRLAAAEREGREQRWRVDARRLTETWRHFERISAQWDGALARLAQFVAASDR